MHSQRSIPSSDISIYFSIRQLPENVYIESNINRTCNCWILKDSLASLSAVTVQCSVHVAIKQKICQLSQISFVNLTKDSVRTLAL